MEVNYSLEPWELKAGFILTCQARPCRRRWCGLRPCRNEFAGSLTPWVLRPDTNVRRPNRPVRTGENVVEPSRRAGSPL